MPAFQRNTPQVTQAIKSCIVRLADGTKRRIIVGEGDGFLREEILVGAEKTVVTYQVFVAGGSMHEIPKKEE